MLSSEILALDERIENWRRFYHEARKIECVSWYTPTQSGNIINDEIALTRMTPEMQAAIEKSISQRKNEVGRIPIHMHDALLMEQAWRALPDQAKKLYIKLEKIDQLSKTDKGCFILWRKMKAYGVRISSFEAHEAYNRATMAYFARNINVPLEK